MPRLAARLPLLAATALLLTGCIAAAPSSSTAAGTSPATFSAPVPANPEATLGGVIRDIDPVGERNHAQALDLYLPTTTATPGPVPLVLFVHGGGWSQGDKQALDDRKAGGLVALVDLLRANGYAVAGVNYRLSGEAQWPAPLHDVQSAVRHLRANAGDYGLDPDRFAIAGESSGGHLALMLGLTSQVDDLQGGRGAFETSAHVASIISYYGVTDLRTLPAERAARGCPPQSPPGGPTLEGTMLGIEPSTEAGARLGALASPVSWVAAGGPPLLLLHGTADCTVLDTQSVRLHEAAVAAGHLSELHLNAANHAWPVFYTDPSLQEKLLTFLAATMPA